MYIEPNSTIKLLSNVPLDPRQTDTLWFANANDQYTYFNAKTVRTFSAYSYQRKERGYLKVEAPPDSIYNVNYMMFRNDSYSNKWFYAFVLSVEYVNDATAYVRFQIDPIQTWFFDYEPEQCFIERIHTRTDAIGDHIEPEPCEVGEYVINGNYVAIGNQFTEQCIVVMYNDAQSESSDPKMQMYGGVFGAVKLMIWGTSTSSIRDLEDYLESQSILQAPDSILGIYMCPKALILSGTFTDGQVVPYGASGIGFDQVLSPITSNDTIDGYTPKNNKMYTYPFSMFHVDTPSGQSLETRYEFFKNLSPAFRVTGNMTAPVELSCIPFNYKNVPEWTELGGAIEYRPERLSIKGFPTCSWSVDAFNAWWAQNSVPIALNAVSNMAGMASMIFGFTNRTGIVRAGSTNARLQGQNFAASMGASAIKEVTDIVSQGYRASISADIMHGSFETGSNDYANHRMYFKGCRMSVKYQMAQRIDDFFTMFGYSYGKIAVPNRHTRSRFTYIKTVDCKMHGDVPADDLATIELIYDNGIRFWADTANVGNYNASNSILT